MHLLKSGIRSAMDIYLLNKMLLMANQKWNEKGWGHQNLESSPW